MNLNGSRGFSMKTDGNGTALVPRQTGALTIIGKQLRLNRKILATHQLAEQTTFIDPTTGMVLQKVIGGTFTMGNTFADEFDYDKELTTHQVTVSDFYIGRYPVTQGEWHAVMGNNPAHFTDEWYAVHGKNPQFFTDEWYAVEGKNALRFTGDGANCPVDR